MSDSREFTPNWRKSLLENCRNDPVLVLIINLTARLLLNMEISRTTVTTYLLPELLHGALGVVQGNVHRVGQRLIEGELGLGIPAFLIGPGALCGFNILVLINQYTQSSKKNATKDVQGNQTVSRGFRVTHRLCCSRSREGWESPQRSWRGRKGSRLRQWCSRRSRGRPSWWRSTPLPWRWVRAGPPLTCLPCRCTDQQRPRGRTGGSRKPASRRSTGSGKLLYYE